MRKPKCVCSDSGCKVKHGNHECGKQASSMLCRSDMSDAYDLPMCDDCTEDAMDSGIFDAKEL